MGSVHVYRTHALPIRGVVGLGMALARRRKPVLVMGVGGRVMAINGTRCIGMWSIVVRCCIRWVLLVPWGVHSGVVRGACWLVPSRPYPVSGVWRARVFLCSLLHLSCVLLWMHSMGTRRLNPCHGHVPTLSLAEFPLAELHLPLLALSFMSLPVRHEPLVLVLHDSNGTLRVIFLGGSQFSSVATVAVHLRRPARFDWPWRTNVRVLPRWAHLPRRHRTARQPSRLPTLLRRRQWRASLGISLRCTIPLQFRGRMVCGWRCSRGCPWVAILVHAVMFRRLRSSESGVLGCC